MLRNILGENYSSEIYVIGEQVKRGGLVTKDLTNKKAMLADGVAVETYIVDYNFVPSGADSDLEISNYTDQADIILANQRALVKKYRVGSQFATDQVDGTFAVGDYAVAGTTTKKGLFVKAVSTKVSTFKWVGTYDDCGHTLQVFEVVEPKTIA